MTEHDVLVGFRLRLFTLADELGNVWAARRAMGVDRSTYYRWKHRVDRGAWKPATSENAGVRGCPTRSARISNSGSSGSRSALLRRLQTTETSLRRSQPGSNCQPAS